MTPAPVEHHRVLIGTWISVLVLIAALTIYTNSWMLAHFERAREANFRTYLELATPLINSGDLAGALGEVKKALTRAPERPEPHAFEGHIRYKLKQWSAAIEAYQRALDYGSTAPGVRSNMLWALIEVEKYEDVVSLGDTFVAQGYAFPTLNRYISEALLRGNEIAKAVPYLEKTLNDYPSDLYILERLRAAYTSIGEPDKATEIASRIEDVHAAFGDEGVANGQ